MFGLLGTEVCPSVRGKLYSHSVPDTNFTTFTARKLRDWAGITPRTEVDLYELCILYRQVGAMGLPRDIIEHIFHFLHEDMGTLKACSLTCRALFSAARRLIHRKVTFMRWKIYRRPTLVERIATKVLRGQRVREVHTKYLPMLSMAEKRGLLGYVQELIIAIEQSLTPETLEVYLPQFRSFSQVQTLVICDFDLTSFLPTFGRFFAQFVPTLRSLHLPRVMGDAHEVLGFICKFPHLDDLSLTLPSSHCIPVPPESSVGYSPPLGGALLLGGRESTTARFLLEIPGGLHFRSIDAGGVDKAELEEILVACSSTLEAFSVCTRARKFTQHYHPPGESHYRLLNHSLRNTMLGTVDLSQNLALAQFELRVGPEDLTHVPFLLHKILSTISSPAFSEFTLKLEGYPAAHHSLPELSIRALWGDEWCIIDQGLDDMVHTTGRDIEFVIEVGMFGGVWSHRLQGFVEDMFPLMSARGLVRAPRPADQEGVLMYDW